MMRMCGAGAAWRAARVAAVAVVAAAACAAPASADPTTPAPGALQGSWDGNTLNLNWQGARYATFSNSFVGLPVSVPGDEAWRTLKIKNKGVCTGIVTVVVLNAEAHYPAGTANSNLPEIIELGWDVDGSKGTATFASVIAAGGGRTLATFPLAQNAEVPVVVGYRFPYSATQGKNAAMPSTRLEFDVRVTIVGDTKCVPKGDTATPTPHPPPRTSATSGPGRTPPPGGGLSDTGAKISGALVLGGCLVLLGVLLRRRREDNTD